MTNKAGENDMKEEKVPIWKKSLLTIEEAAEYSNIGTKRLYELTKDSKCKFVFYVGRRKLIKRRQFDEFIENQIEI